MLSSSSNERSERPSCHSHSGNNSDKDHCSNDHDDDDLIIAVAVIGVLIVSAAVIYGVYKGTEYIIKKHKEKLAKNHAKLLHLISDVYPIPNYVHHYYQSAYKESEKARYKDMVDNYGKQLIKLHSEIVHLSKGKAREKISLPDLSDLIRQANEKDLLCKHQKKAVRYDSYRKIRRKILTGKI